MAGDENKLFLPLGGLPLLTRTLRAVEAAVEVTDVVLVVRPDDEAVVRRRILPALETQKFSGLAHGGPERQDSVRAGVLFIGDRADLVVVHDGARPLVTPALVDRTVAAARDASAATTAVPVKDTVKRVEDGRVRETLDRRSLWLAQTPQAFWADLLAFAHARAAEADVRATDDAALVERLGHRVVVVPGAEENLKITTPLDLAIAELILRRREAEERG